jgi:RNA-dependent RNA polymerase
VIITRNPSLSPADVRKCRCLSLEEIDKRMKKIGNESNYFDKFVNCIVFPKKGAIPLTAQISGSDLDGDIFFICWEKDFVIEKNQPCETIDDPNSKSTPYYGGSTYK